MIQSIHNKQKESLECGAFSRIAKPYSGQAPQGCVQAKLVRGIRVSNLASLAKNL